MRLGAVATVLSLAASGVSAAPQPAPATPPIAAAAERSYPGALNLVVDATDLTHAIFSVSETVPVAGPGPLTLLYPKWLPGNHGPTGPLDKLAGLTVSANGQSIAWVRDPVDVYAFHLDVPAGVTAVTLRFQFLSPVTPAEGRMMMTPAMLSLQWNTVVLYPAGYFSRDIPVDAQVVLPEGFTAATALEPVSRIGPQIRFRTVGLNTLVDSPLIAGRNFRRIDLAAQPRVSLDVVADKPEELSADAIEIDAHKALVIQAYRLFGSRHYDHYDFLLSLSDELGGIGLEHHQSSEDGTIPRYFLDWPKTPAERDLLAHEFTHSWNGKFRRPADLWTPNFNTPMRDSLLWVYEGQTQYWGYVLAARSGLMSRQEALDAIALTAAAFDDRPGRRWRDLADTTNDPIVVMRRSEPWPSWQRGEDYYSEGELIWLDADTLIRSLSGGKRSLDDFARGFFGIDDGAMVTRTYTFDDIVAALTAVQPYDWSHFLRQRLDGHGPGAPLDGLARGGYRLTFDAEKSPYLESVERIEKAQLLNFSLGAIVSAKDGTLTSVTWEGPAFKAGLVVGAQIVAVGGEAFTPELLEDAVKDAARNAAPITLLIKRDGRFRTVELPYHGGLRYPHLTPQGAGPRALDAILTARSK